MHLPRHLPTRHQCHIQETLDLPISQAALADLADGNDYVEIPLTTISWYHHISLLPKINSDAERAFYILETTRNGWSRTDA